MLAPLVGSDGTPCGQKEERHSGAALAHVVAMMPEALVSVFFVVTAT